jgi:hypothetical protein
MQLENLVGGVSGQSGRVDSATATKRLDNRTSIAESSAVDWPKPNLTAVYSVAVTKW